MGKGKEIRHQIVFFFLLLFKRKLGMKLFKRKTCGIMQILQILKLFIKIYLFKKKIFGLGWCGYSHTKP
jgi:hypothetical protein